MRKDLLFTGRTLFGAPAPKGQEMDDHYYGPLKAQVVEYMKELETSKTKAVLLCVAGLSAALPGVVVMNTELPVIGVPVPCGPLNGVDALLAISQLPGGVPATTVGLHKKTPVNAAMAAHRIIKLAE